MLPNKGAIFSIHRSFQLVTIGHGRLFPDGGGLTLPEGKDCSPPATLLAPALEINNRLLKINSR